jgi:hypothetical protein
MGRIQRRRRGPGVTDQHSPFELETRRLWHEWGNAWSRYTLCHGCGLVRYCGAARRGGPFLCLGCFDISPEAMRMLRRNRS